MKPMVLVAMRLVDMGKVHPEQVTMRCARCNEPVGVYPSGQKALRFAPGPIEVVCVACAAKTVTVDDINQPAGPWPEIIQETRDSVPVKRA